ncbi:hypothetical protein F4823DRAFT_379055 [Ustulina deusta]|nr:hypothetical protein F4823DRAFT_379055 [Ustulina deusta]
MLEAKDQLSPFTSLTKEKWNVMNGVTKKWLIWMYIGTKKKHLMALRDDIEKSIKDLQDDANYAWLWKRGRRISDSVKVDDVRHKGIYHFLVPLVMANWQGLDGMRQICQAAREKYRTELELDIFGSSRTILSAAEAKRVKLGILSQSIDLNETLSGHMNSSCIEKLEVTAQRGLSGAAAVLDVLEGKRAESDFVTTEKIQFSIRRLNHSHAPNTKRTCFWKT